ncbi:Hpt domain-containing protein [Azovibrio restrictus]|uniref:hybrid sensor histidine kinase/response regulator n=1 Tax=Azovibrio restrictus TaxID=146938 RepID=UPI0026E948AF|nr:Hpt domain-containing protein [Azovibrio restrictus]
MNAATDFDLGPLTWVKGEIDLALERATEALQLFQQQGDATQLKFCRTHLHQVHGALSVVGLDGVTQFTEALESLLQALENGEVADPEATQNVAREAFATLRQYLDDLLAGEPNQPLRLFPVYQAVATARGSKPASPTDLFFPDLSLRPPKRPAGVPLTQEERIRLIRSERSRFQKGLLNWLRHPDGSSDSLDGLTLMQEALRRIEATQISPSARSFWWAALGLVTALAHGAGTAGDARALCARIDLQIRRLLEGNPGVAERLLRDCLYFIAHSPAQADPLLAEIQQTYQLGSLIPSRKARRPASSAPQEATLRRLRETIATAEEQWNRFCAGSASALAAFVEQTRHSAQLATQLEHAELDRLAQSLTAAANWLAQQPSRQSDGVAMEIATALLLLQTALENYNHLGQDFPQQVDLMVRRLQTCMAGGTPEDSDVPLLDEMSRRAQERLLMAQVAREIQSNLAQIEQTLDAYFRDTSKRPESAALEGPLRQIAGALTILGQDAAVRYLQDCERQILQFARNDVEAETGAFETVAQQLSTLGFFVDALQHGNIDFETFLGKLQGRPAAEEATPEEWDTGIGETPDASVETQLNQLKAETRALLDALKGNPDDPTLRDDLQAHLQALQKDADLVADQALLAQARAALSALTAAGPGEEAPQMQAVEAALAPLAPQAEAPAPSAETLQLAQASTDELDAELLEIFLEEAREVLATIDSNLALLRRQPHDVDTLTTIRRSTHTLKGSGRMVGLKDLGETAWAVEQTLNQWLRQEREVTPELLEMIALTHQVFSVWVDHLASGDGLMPDPQPLIILAERLRGVEAPAQAAPAASAAAAPAEARLPETAPEAAAGLEPAPLEGAPKEPDLSGAGTVPAEIPAELLASRFDLAPLDSLEAEAAPPPSSAAEPEMADLDFRFDLDTESEIPGKLPPLESEGEAALPETVAGSPGAGTPAQAEAEVAAAAVEEAVPEPSATSAPQPAGQTLTISPQLYEIFRDEARGHMDCLHRFLDELAQTPGMPTPFETGRAAHTLAGIAGTVGITPINKLGQALEHALLRRDAAQHPDSLEGLEVLRQTMDMLESMLERLAQGQMPAPQPSLIDALSQLYPARTETRDKDMVAVLEETLEAIEPTDTADAPDTAATAETAGQPDSAPPAELPPLLNDEMDEQLLPIFLEEAQELVEGFHTQISAWKADPGSSAAPNALARLLHTFKGSSRMAGAMNLGQLTHAVESRVSELAHSAEVTPADLDEIEAACDLLAQTVERYQAGDFSLPAAPATAAVPEAPHSEAPHSEVPRSEAPRSETAMPTSAPASIAPVSVAPPDTPEPEVGQKALLRVRADLVDQLVNEAGELSIARARIEGEMRELKESLLDLTGNVIRLRHQLREIEIQAESQIQANTRHEAKADFDPLELDRFTRFQELTRMMAESVNDVATVQQNLLKNLDDANAALVAQARLNRSLQQSLMSVRMVPFASQSERLYRLVRQTAKEVGKRANLELQGGQVELDRSVLEKVLSPLEHMLRNAVAHGLETREQRLAAGKEEIGEITLSLAQEGNEIILTLSDDGAGLDLGRIRAKAESAGLIAPGEQVDDQRLVDFIFHSGFSTAAEISQVAGRGVGMDVVKTEVTGLGGRIEVLTEPGKGTTFRLYLPLTLAVTQTVLVKAGERLFAIPSAMIEQVMEIREKALEEIRSKGAAVWQDHHYPFHYLPRLLGDTQTQPEHRRLYWVLLLRSGTQRVAIQVDDMKGNQEIVVKNVGPQMARVVGIAGATVLGDGQVVLILNPVALATRMPDISASIERPRPQVVEPAPAPAPAPQQPTILVVDDSLTVRKITSKLLSREGYQVQLAKDGVDALEQLIDRIPDVILSDIEMPRMDGFDLVRNIRADERLIHVPIIMITSRTADKHRNYAMEIGANHYLGKPYDEEELLRLLAEYTGRA